MRSPAAVVLALGCALAQLAAGVADAALALESPKVALSAGALEFAIVASPAQPALKHVTVDTLVDTTGASLVSDLKVKGNGDKFVVALKGDKKLPAGMYKMKVSAFDNDTQTTTSDVLQLKVTVPVVVAAAEVNGADVAFGDKLPLRRLSAGSADSLQVQVELQQKHDKKPVTAHQAVLKFTHAADKTSTYFVLPADKGANTHGTVLHFSLLSSKFAYKSGLHHVELVIGDPTFESALVWNLGDVDLELAAEPPVAPSPLYAKPLLHESDTTLKALPEIKHVMRPQDSRPPVTVSLAFTAAVLLPLAVFLLFALKLKLNLNKLFQASVLPFGVVFLASLSAILALFAWYWLELTMFRTLGYLSGLATVTLWSGHLTLKRLAQPSAAKKSKTE